MEYGYGTTNEPGWLDWMDGLGGCAGYIEPIIDARGRSASIDSGSPLWPLPFPDNVPGLHSHLFFSFSTAIATTVTTQEKYTYQLNYPPPEFQIELPYIVSGHSLRAAKAPTPNKIK
ncbi:hypothetical protein K440DRAFT_188166 [Wilcoxina mikolae CBS 423.85]|nr:hypothetical protein K440DRAFT_188166 [Wilcoxina mikolae CBS 423.85]